MSIACGILNYGRYYWNTVIFTSVVFYKLFKCFCLYKRCITIKNKNIFVFVYIFLCLHYGMTCAKLFFLNGKTYAFVFKSLLNSLWHMTSNNTYIFCFKVFCCINNSFYHRSAHNLVQYLRHFWFHSCSLACGKNNSIYIIHILSTPQILFLNKIFVLQYKPLIR